MFYYELDIRTCSSKGESNDRTSPTLKHTVAAPGSPHR